MRGPRCLAGLAHPIGCDGTARAQPLRTPRPPLPTPVPTLCGRRAPPSQILEKQVTEAASAELPMAKDLDEIEAKIVNEFNKPDGIVRRPPSARARRHMRPPRRARVAPRSRRLAARSAVRPTPCDPTRRPLRPAPVVGRPRTQFELASKEEKAAEATLLECVAEMEKLSVDADGISEVTIAEILEREPELRAEIEEEIRNNVWAP